jgi:hypothetical protein
MKNKIALILILILTVSIQAQDLPRLPGLIYPQPVQQHSQTFYVQNLSATDDRYSGSYYTITPIPNVIPVIPVITAPPKLYRTVSDEDEDDENQ